MIGYFWRFTVVIVTHIFLSYPGYPIPIVSLEGSTSDAISGLKAALGEGFVQRSDKSLQHNGSVFLFTEVPHLEGTESQRVEELRKVVAGLKVPA